MVLKLRDEVIDLLGINIDSRLSFDRHITNIHVYSKVNNQLQVMRHSKNLVSKDVRERLYKAFILPYFQYCSAVWHFCGVHNSDTVNWNYLTNNYCD